MEKILCFLGIHNFSKWEYIGVKDKYQIFLKRTCHRCGKIEYYEGIVETDVVTGEVSPYFHKN